MIDWTTFTNDPNDPTTQSRVLEEIRRIQLVHCDTDLVGYVERVAAGKRMLDIGMADPSHFLGDAWRHHRFTMVASYCLGIDINKRLVEGALQRGYNVREVDATSEIDLGVRFDLVFNGDVIEHVDNPIRLMKFSARHLAPGGRILVSTPNPFSHKFYRKFRRAKTAIVNLDHVAWFTPTMANEIARRSGLRLEQIHLVRRMGVIQRALKNIAWNIEPIEYSFPAYLFEFSRPSLT
ncbi:MAG TPA: class I SAM-dependent methyltransferase [Nitrospiria bacterium]|nr:class I SAM-dependent methyltransferase [Nitrospiria bacterium]